MDFIAKAVLFSMLSSWPQSKWTLLASVFSAFVPLINADPSNYTACQEPTMNPLDGCPPNTLRVSQTDCSADFFLIQDAINALPNDNSSWTIRVDPGIYVEQLNVTRTAPLTILGQTSNAREQADNTVTISWSSANVNSRYADNAFTSVLTVAPNLAASLTGSGPTGYAVPPDTPFGNEDFRVYNIDFRNEYSELSDGPALAVSISRANAGLYYCGFYSYQDTVSHDNPPNSYPLICLTRVVLGVCRKARKCLLLS